MSSTNATSTDAAAGPVFSEGLGLVERLDAMAAGHPDADLLREAAREIERLWARLEKAEHWAKHAMLMRSSQNEELLRILRGEA